MSSKQRKMDKSNPDKKIAKLFHQLTPENKAHVAQYIERVLLPPKVTAPAALRERKKRVVEKLGQLPDDSLLLVEGWLKMRAAINRTAVQKDEH